jgi:hypothetical protein
MPASGVVELPEDCCAKSRDEEPSQTAFAASPVEARKTRREIWLAWPTLLPVMGAALSANVFKFSSGVDSFILFNRQT